MTILDAWPDLVDARTGIIREVAELRIDDDDPPFVHYLSTSSNTEAFGLLPNFGNNGGVGTSARSALAKALGEGVERYCSAFFDVDDFVWSSFADLRSAATAPESFALYSGEQYATADFPWRPFDRDAPVAWTRGRSLVTGEELLVPAAFVHVPFHYLSDRPDTPITQPISTGLACGAGFRAAASSALCEVIERDAFTLMWQAGLTRPRIRQSTLPAVIRDLVDRYRSVQLTVHLVDLTTDVGCPTVMSIAEGDADTSPALAVANASHPNPVLAARKSLEELAHTRKFAAQVMDYQPALPVDVAGGHPEVDGQRAHLRFYCDQPSKTFAAFSFSGPECRDLTEIGTVADDLDALVAAVAATGEDVIAVDLTTPDVAEIGLSVVRVVVPGFHPLQMGHGNRCLGGRRLANHPSSVGGGRFELPHDNPYPHPFP